MQVKTEDFTDYLSDASNLAGGHAEKLFIPETPADISSVLLEANKSGIPVTISGGRTGTVGGAMPLGGYVVSMERLNRIEEIGSGYVVAESGVVLGDLQKAVEGKGLFYPPDPTEWSCQIGGTIATNASGARSFKYGATRNFVEGLEVVLADGDMVNISRGEAVSANGEVIRLETKSGRHIEICPPGYSSPDVRKNTAGYFSAKKTDALDLFIGSEGTLGVVTKARLRLLPRPESFFSGIVFFNDEECLLAFTDEAKRESFESRLASGGMHRAKDAMLNATLIEYFDENALKFIAAKFPEVPGDAKGAIFFEQESKDAEQDELLEKWNYLLEKHSADLENSWFTTTETDLKKMRDFRHALPVAVNEWIVRHKQRKVGTDMAVPDRNFRNMLYFYRKTLDSFGLNYLAFGHIGDNHLHVNILPRDAQEMKMAKFAYGRFIAQALMLGGTVSAEHGIGKLKRNYLYAMYGERYLNEMGEIKKALDPNGILGRGNIFSEQYLPR